MDSFNSVFFVLKSFPFDHQVFWKCFPNLRFNSTNSTFPSSVKGALVLYPNLSWPLPPLHSLLALITRSVRATQLQNLMLQSLVATVMYLALSIDAATCRMAGGCELQVLSLFLGGFGLGWLDGPGDILNFSFIWNWKQSVKFETFIYAVYFDWLEWDVTLNQ